MHDPLCVAFEIRSPFSSPGIGKTRYHKPIITVWHKDPCRDGTDDSCGRFMRSRHGKKEVLENIVKRFEWDWDRVFKSDSGKHYYCGYFYPESDGAGMPNMGVSAIVFNLFFHAAYEVFGTRKRAVRFMRKNTVEILLFAENPVDSLRDSIVRKFGQDEKREDRIRSIASCIYGWILRANRPWYKHPNLHVHHWRIQWHLGQLLWRFLFSKCAVCGKRFRWKEAPMSDWNGTKIWHDRCQTQPDHKPLLTH